MHTTTIYFKLLTDIPNCVLSAIQSPWPGVFLDFQGLSRQAKELAAF